MPLLLLRHGETLWNQQGILQGRQDSPLSPRGWQQAARCAELLRAAPISHIYSSDSGRAADFATRIATPSQLPLTLLPGLRERSFGALEGTPRSGHPAYWQAYAARFEHDQIAIPGAEPASAVAVRVQQMLHYCQQQHTADDTLLLVTHGEWIRILCNVLQGLPAWSGTSPLPDNAQWITISALTSQQ